MATQGGDDSWVIVRMFERANHSRYSVDNGGLSNGLNNASRSPEGAFESGERPLYEVILVASILGILDLLTILGNLLVCVTIASVRRLQNMTNYFIFSLALGDLFLGCLVLPFSTLNTLLPEHWPLGAIFCNIFVSTDVMLCTVSILHLFTISLDRYFAVTAPYKYCQAVQPRRVLAVLASIWIFSFLMAFVPIHLGWNTEDGTMQNLKDPTRCVFEANAIYVLLVSIGTYFAPLIIMCAVYIKVFIITRKQVERINNMVKYTSESPSQKSDCPASDHKAIFTLASVVTAFTICWVPYFVIFTARPFIPYQIDTTLDLFVLWLGYVNSILNPFLYAFHSTEFRFGFMWILCRKRAERYREKLPPPQYV